MIAEGLWIDQILMALVDRSDVLEALQQDLTRRYGADYEVIAETSTTIGLEILERLHKQRNTSPLLADHRAARRMDTQHGAARLYRGGCRRRTPIRP